MKKKHQFTIEVMNERLKLATGMVTSVNTSATQSGNQALMAIAHCMIALTTLARDSYEEHVNDE